MTITINLDNLPPSSLSLLRQVFLDACDNADGDKDAREMCAIAEQVESYLAKVHGEP